MRGCVNVSMSDLRRKELWAGEQVSRAGWGHPQDARPHANLQHMERKGRDQQPGDALEEAAGTLPGASGGSAARLDLRLCSPDFGEQRQPRVVSAVSSTSPRAAPRGILRQTGQTGGPEHHSPSGLLIPGFESLPPPPAGPSHLCVLASSPRGKNALAEDS